MSRAVVLVAFLVACGTPKPPAPPAEPVRAAPPALPLDHDMPRLASLTLKLYQSTATALTAADATCATVAMQLGSVKAANTDYFAARATVITEGRTRALQDAIDANEAHGQPLATAAALILNAPLMKSCAKDRAFTDAYEALFGG